MTNELAKRNARGGLVVKAAVLVWVLLLSCGTYKLLHYENNPGRDLNPPTRWPAQISIVRSPERFTLVMLVHPKCSCSSASIGELAKIMAKSHGRLDAKVLFLVPNELHGDWSNSATWTAAGEIPGVDSIADVDGRLAKLFNAKTSGFTVLYNRNGELVFHGGITAARGHWGDNAGSEAIQEFVDGKAPALNSTAAFGCNLFKRH